MVAMRQFQMLKKMHCMSQNRRENKKKLNKYFRKIVNVKT